MAAEVDARLGDRRVADGWDVVERQDRIALGGGLVGPGGDHPVAVGVLQLEVDPILHFRRQVFGLELARREQQLQVLTTELVAIDRHLVRIELVVGAQTLDVFQRLRQGELRVPEPGVLHRLRIASHRVRRQRVLGGEGAVGDIG